MAGKIVTIISENKDVIQRKLIVTVGTGLGMLIASSLLTRLTNTRPDVIVIEMPDTTPDTTPPTEQ
jgi:hypothetical protein